MKKINYNAPVCLTFTFIAFFVLIFNIVTQYSFSTLLFSTYGFELLNPLFYIRLISYIFGHIGYSHFYNNFVTILLLGPILEEKYSSKNLTIMILITAVCSALIHNLIFKDALIGASGIVFMLISLAAFTNHKKNTIPLTIIIIIAIMFGKEIYEALMNKDNISQLTHILGGVFGIFFGSYFEKNSFN